MLDLDPLVAKEKLETVLAVAHWISPALPVLAVQWASGMAIASNVPQSSRIDATKLALAHAPAAYAVDPIATREALLFGAWGSLESGLDCHFTAMLHRLEPEMTAGPWGLRPEGQDREQREREAARTVWDRLSDVKHRVLHRPGPNDVTVTLSGLVDPTGKDGSLTRLEP